MTNVCLLARLFFPGSLLTFMGRLAIDCISRNYKTEFCLEEHLAEEGWGDIAPGEMVPSESFHAF